MQEPEEASRAHSAASFASLLAALASPATEPASDDDGFGDDIATLSYEQALRAHARYRPADAGELPPPQGSRWQDQRGEASGASRPAATRANGSATARNQADRVVPRAAKRRSTVPPESRKSASITIRLSAAEGAQLRARAAEAELTVSAYLRSCALEVEELRTQVKEALTQFRSVASIEEQPSPRRAFSPLPTWRARIFPRWMGSQRAAHA